MSLQMTLDLTLSAISLPESAAGQERLDSQDGPTINPYSVDLLHASLSPRQAREQGLLTSGTYGPRSFGTSSSVALASCLASKSHQQMPCGGGMLWRLTWKTRTTPALRSICALRASALTTSGSDCTGWQTPTVQDSNGRDRHNQRDGSIKLSLLGESRIAAWPTPKAQNANSPGIHGNGGQDLQTIASWSTPTVNDAKNNGSASQQSRNTLALNSQASGTTQSGSPAQTESSGQLNPAFALWLQGYPTEWALCAARVTRSSRRLQRNSSKQ